MQTAAEAVREGAESAAQVMDAATSTSCTIVTLMNAAERGATEEFVATMAEYSAAMRNVSSKVNGIADAVEIADKASASMAHKQPGVANYGAPASSGGFAKATTPVYTPSQGKKVKKSAPSIADSTQSGIDEDLDSDTTPKKQVVQSAAATTPSSSKRLTPQERVAAAREAKAKRLGTAQEGIGTRNQAEAIARGASQPEASSSAPQSECVGIITIGCAAQVYSVGPTIPLDTL